MQSSDIRHLAVYGKGGIGKSTVCSNLSAALAKQGRRVMQVGCDPKADSTACLAGGMLPVTLLEQVRRAGVSKEAIQEVITIGYNGVVCVEAGGPRPGKGCAGKGVALALTYLDKYGLFQEYGVDTVFYDVLGDVVCGGFAQPIRDGYAQEICLVTSGEMMALYAANNIAFSVASIIEEGASVGIIGLISNMRNVPGERELVEAFAQKLNVPLLAHIPRSDMVQWAEAQRKTVIEAFPDSDQSAVYEALAQRILDKPPKVVPQPMTMDDIMVLLAEYQMLPPVMQQGTGLHQAAVGGK